MILEGVKDALGELQAVLNLTAFEEYAAVHSAGFDAARRGAMPTVSRLFLLKRAGQTKKFSVIREVIVGWFVGFSDRREQLKIMIAASDFAVFADHFAQTSFVAFGAADAAGEFKVYNIDLDRGDKVSPSGNEPYWKIFVSDIPMERFTPV